VRRHDFDALRGVDFGRLDDEGADALLRPRENDVEVGDAAVGDPGLFAVEAPAAGAAQRARFERLDVGAGSRLGERERTDRLAGGRSTQVALLLLGGPGERDGNGREARHGEGEVRKPGVVGEHFAQQRDRANVGPLRHAVVEESGAAQVLHQALADRIRVRAAGVREVRVRPRVGLDRELRMPLLEKGPVVVFEPVHQSPWNRGFCFAANAS
jgi:hypothetical protein